MLPVVPPPPPAFHADCASGELLPSFRPCPLDMPLATAARRSPLPARELIPSLPPMRRAAGARVGVALESIKSEESLSPSSWLTHTAGCSAIHHLARHLSAALSVSAEPDHSFATLLCPPPPLYRPPPPRLLCKNGSVIPRHDAVCVDHVVRGGLPVVPGSVPRWQQPRRTGDGDLLPEYATGWLDAVAAA